MKITCASLLLALGVFGTTSSAFVVKPQTALSKATAFSMNPLLGGDLLEPSTALQRIEGQTLRTWKVHPDAQKVHVHVESDGRPVHCDIAMWHGPDYTAATMSVYLENGSISPCNVIMKPKGYGLDTIQVKNTASMEFPAGTAVGQDGPSDIYNVPEQLLKTVKPRLIQGGGAVTTYTLNPAVDRVAVGLMAESHEARNNKFRLELLHGPNNVKQSIEFYASNAYKTPFYGVFQTPGEGYAVRIRNEYPVEFPITAYVEAVQE